MANEKAPYKRDWRESTETAAKKGDPKAITEMKEQAAKERKNLADKDRFGAKASAYGADILETLANPLGRDTSNINKLKGEINMLKSNVKKYEDQGYAKGGNVGSKGQGLPRGKATYSAHQTMVEDGDADNITVERNPNDKRLNHLYRSPIGGNFKNLNEASEYASELQRETRGMKKGGKVKKMASGGKTSSASSRADGCAQRGKTKGRMI